MKRATKNKKAIVEAEVLIEKALETLKSRKEHGPITLPFLVSHVRGFLTQANNLLKGEKIK